MHIEFVRTGGFAGMHLATKVDTTELASEQAATLDKLISEASFFQLPEKLVPERPAPDRFEYHVTVSGSKHTHSVIVSDAAAPESLRPLLNYLTTLAMVSRKS